MKILGLVAAAAIAFGFPTQSRAQQTVHVVFSPPQYVFMCHSLDDMSWIAEGVGLGMGKPRRDAKRVPVTAGSPPPCDFIKDVNRQYMPISSYANLEMLSAVPSYSSGQSYLELGIYRAHDLAGNPMYMLLGLEVSGGQHIRTVEMLTFLYGTQ